MVEIAKLLPSPEDIEAAKTPHGGWTRAQLAQWGVPWPPPKGWRAESQAKWELAQKKASPHKSASR